MHHSSALIPAPVRAPIPVVVRRLAAACLLSVAGLLVACGSSSAPPPEISSLSLPTGPAGAAYDATLTATGGTPPYSWSITSGALPAGLTLSSAGVLSGKPTTPGTYIFWHHRHRC